MEYMESEVIELLKQQRENCAKELNFMSESQLEEAKKKIINAPLPELKK